MDVATTSRYAIDRQELRESLINERYWLVPEAYAVLDLLTFEPLPLVNPEALALYDVSMHALGDDAVQVTITSREGAGSAVYAVSFAE
ncbi:MAG: hypothetical protein KME04_15330 [Pleurocapsa minor GSE-CHR-MK-17-07R]|nr:hypothetical protein [Pleurocapsa minor GSE-CHR-MK 17-07R]